MIEYALRFWGWFFLSSGAIFMLLAFYLFVQAALEEGPLVETFVLEDGEKFEANPVLVSLISRTEEK